MVNKQGQAITQLLRSGGGETRFINIFGLYRAPLQMHISHRFLEVNEHIVKDHGSLYQTGYSLAPMFALDLDRTFENAKSPDHENKKIKKIET
jgi:hypothetical protein